MADRIFIEQAAMNAYSNSGSLDGNVPLNKCEELISANVTGIAPLACIREKINSFGKPSLSQDEFVTVFLKVQEEISKVDGAAQVKMLFAAMTDGTSNEVQYHQMKTRLMAYGTPPRAVEAFFRKHISSGGTVNAKMLDEPEIAKFATR